MILVEEPGLFTTVQDLGRPGFGPIGVSAAGAADVVALRVGNRMVGNPEGAAALEMTLSGGTFLFPNGGMAALAGSDFGAAMDHLPAPVWQTFEIPRGGRVRVGQTRSGARCYLCVRGGIDVPLVLGSASTHVLCGLGGFQGRTLRKGDVLRIGKAGIEYRARAGGLPDALQPRKTLRCTGAPQTGWFSETDRGLFHNSIYRVTEDANRAGLRLEGPVITAPAGGHMTTAGAPLGAIQVPASGQPIILFVEQQTTGGYPEIASIITADISSVGQLRPRDEVRFECVDLATARDLLRKQEEAIRAVH